jgi:hypothetical protein
MTHRTSMIVAVLLMSGSVAMAQTAAGAKTAAPILPANDYPTVATADYVFGCMQANGNTPQSLQRCSCSFDVVASIVPYEQYVEASTFLSMGQVTGEKGTLFKTGVESKRVIGDLRRAQAEAEIRCFE